MVKLEIDIPKEMLEAIDSVIDGFPEYGFEDRDEFIREGIRQMIVAY